MNRRQQPRKSRRGAVTALAAILAIVLVGMVAFSVDIGYVLSAKEELQRSADAAALASCWEYGERLSKGSSSTLAAQHGRTVAAQYAAANRVTGNGMSLDPNTANSANGDIVYGLIDGVGYLRIDAMEGYSIEAADRALLKAVELFQGAESVVIDVRRNGQNLQLVIPRGPLGIWGPSPRETRVTLPAEER